MTPESAIGEDEFMLDLVVIDAFINKEVTSQHEYYVWEEPYQGLTDSPNMDDVVDQENSEKDVATYDQFIGADVCPPDK